MRIVCPRCVAQYEVDESAIPESGREVQCANCENIWFQDYIEMLPTAGDPDVPAEEDLGGFADVEDWNEDFDDDDDDDDAPATNLPVPPVNEDVLDILRSEAAFSSARNQLDAAAANALDGDGEAIKSALDDTDASDAEPDLDDLSAFLDTHAQDEEDDTLEDDYEDIAESEPIEPEPSSDPLADLNAIRSQLNDIDTDQSELSDYEPNLPPDDPIDMDIVDAGDDALDVIKETIGDTAEDVANEIDDALDDIEPELEEAEFDAAALAVALDSEGEADTPDDDFDDFDDKDDGTRHAYRADAVASDAEDTTDDIEDAVETEMDAADLATAAVTGAAAAVGMTRPRAANVRNRARDFVDFDDTADSPADDIDLTDFEEDVAAAVDTDRKTDPNRRPKGDRKAILPDVEELDASLRSEGEEPRRRDREMMEAHENEQAKASKGGFRRAFVWTLFIIAPLIALYILRPQLVDALPAAAVVLDPYAAAIDTLRTMINELLG